MYHPSKKMRITLYFLSLRCFSVAIIVILFVIPICLGFVPRSMPSRQASAHTRDGFRKIKGWKSTRSVFADPSLSDYCSSVSSICQSKLVSSQESWQIPLTNSLLAGLSTCIGAGVVFLPFNEKEKSKSVDDQWLAFSLALAGSVMLTVSIFSILPESFENVSFNSSFFWQRCISIALGCGLYVWIEKSFPEPEEVLNEQNTFYTTRKDQGLGSFIAGSDLTTKQRRREWRITWLLFISLAIHNFPEGLAVAASSVQSQDLGFSTAIAIALHNIPEGVAISVPCLSARPDSPLLAFLLASMSGLAEPIGAAIALFLLNGATSNVALEDILAFVAGIMTTVALVELFPEAQKHAHHNKLYLWMGSASGVAVMLISEAVLS